MNLYIKRPNRKTMWLVALLIGVIAGTSYFAYDKFFAKRMMYATVNPYNFTDVAVVDLFVNGTWGGSVGANSGGGGSVCCVMVPEKWRPGLTANVKWKKSGDEKWYTADAEIPRYTESAGLQVLFLKNNKIKLYLLDYWPCSPMHPMLKDKELCGDTKQP